MERKIKILHANTGLVAGGAERIISDIVPFMKNDEFNVEILLLEDKGNNIFDKQIERENIKINYIKYNNKFDLRNFFAIRKLIKEFDIVHTHIFPIQYWVPLASIGLRKKPILITTEHNTFNRRRRIKLLRYIEKIIYGIYDRVISISEESENSLIKWLRVKKNDKFRVVYNGINIKKFNNADSIDLSNILGINVSSSDKFLLMVARFDEQKDHDTLFKALRLLEPNVKLILVGEGDLESHYKKITKEYNIENRVFFLGRRNDVPEITKSIDISILSSEWEGFGLVAVEAMAAGKPVVASRVPGLENVVENAGLLFEKGNFTELADIIRMLLNKEDIYKSISKKCIQRSKRYSIENMANQYLDIYLELIKK